MKKKLFITLVALIQFPFFSFSVEYIKLTEIEDRNGITFHKGTNNKVTGAVRVFYPNGAIKIHVELLNGIQHGSEIWWYQNGNKRHEVQFDHGSQLGCWVFWHQNGQISQIHGKDMVVGYHENGQKQRIVIYDNKKMIFSKEWNVDGSEKK